MPNYGNPACLESQVGTIVPCWFCANHCKNWKTVNWQIVYIFYTITYSYFMKFWDNFFCQPLLYTNSKNRPQETSSSIYTKAICKLKIIFNFVRMRERRCVRRWNPKSASPSTWRSVRHSTRSAAQQSMSWSVPQVSEECFTKYEQECETFYRVWAGVHHSWVRSASLSMSRSLRPSTEYEQEF